MKAAQIISVKNYSTRGTAHQCPCTFRKHPCPDLTRSGCKARSASSARVCRRHGRFYSELLLQPLRDDEHRFPCEVWPATVDLSPLGLTSLHSRRTGTSRCSVQQPAPFTPGCCTRSGGSGKKLKLHSGKVNQLTPAGVDAKFAVCVIVDRR